MLDVPSAGVAPTMAAESRLVRAAHIRAVGDRIRPSSLPRAPTESFPPNAIPEPEPEPEPVVVETDDDDAALDIDPENLVGGGAETEPEGMDVDPEGLDVDPDAIAAGRDTAAGEAVEEDAGDEPDQQASEGFTPDPNSPGGPPGGPSGGPAPGGGSPVGGILDILKKAVGLGGGGNAAPTPPPAPPPASDDASDPDAGDSDAGDSDAVESDAGKDAGESDGVESDSGADSLPPGGTGGNGGFKNVEPGDARADAILKKLGSQGRRRAAALMKEARSLYEAGDYEAAKKTALEAHALHPSIAAEVEALIQQIERGARE